MGRVLGDLAALGYDAEWSVLSACAVGAPHTRERVFILAYTDTERRSHGGRFQLAENRNSERNLSHWQRESEPDRMAHGIPARMDRIERLGNAVVPQVAEWLGRQIVEAAS